MCEDDAREPKSTFTRMHKYREGFYGWLGSGGSTFQWHPELKIGFGYVTNLLALYDPMAKKAGNLQLEVVKCVKILRTQNSLNT